MFWSNSGSWVWCVVAVWYLVACDIQEARIDDLVSLLALNSETSLLLLNEKQKVKMTEG